MSNGPIIRVSDLRKVYRLYSKPQYRLLDMVGLLSSRRYTERPALDGITLEIERGEKVAIIGRNGAGKSTLLKLITRAIQPTSGTIEVQGQTHALLQIGTGFHPDFTGRENVFAYLAQLGVSGQDARRSCAEIVEFAELEDYIDQPLKTYSTGMAVRLMFSTATAISPDVLVLDEILGVGDAYFAHKSYERIRVLAEHRGTTLMLVTHDLYSAVQICERVVWLDHGRVVMDGDGRSVVKAYEDSIRAQEERRLRRRRLERLQAAGGSKLQSIIVEVQAPMNVPLAEPVYFSKVELKAGSELLGRLDFSSPDESIPRAALVAEESVWGDLQTWEGRRARPMLNYGAPYHKVGVEFRIPAQSLGKAWTVEVDGWCSAGATLVARAYLTDKHAELGSLVFPAGVWHTARSGSASLIVNGSAAPLAEINPTGVHGTGRMTLEQVAVRDASGVEHYQLTHGEEANVDLYFAIPDSSFNQRVQVLVAFQRDGVTDVCRIIARHLRFDASTMTRGCIRLHIDRLGLAPGAYALSVMIAEEGYYDREQVLFYSINPSVYCCLSRVCDIVVSGGGAAAAGTGVVLEGQWTILAS